MKIYSIKLFVRLLRFLRSLAMTDNKNNHMKLAKKSKTKIWKLTAYFCLLVFIFSFSFSKAEETILVAEEGAPIGETGAAALAPAVVAVKEEALLSEAISEDPLESAVVAVPAESLAETPTENLTPLIATTSEPIIFDFSQPAETVTSATAALESVNNVAGESQAVGAVNPILHEVLTGIIRDADIKGLTILAQWQMLNEKADGNYLGADESVLSGAQFLPSGQFAISKSMAVCALVADAGGSADLNSISATINYPAAIAKAVNQAGEINGCGQLKTQFNLEKINSLEAVALVCDKLRNNNNNLLAWGSDKIDNLVYSYEHLCGQDGLLVKTAAALYCAETILTYDDPAGNYLVKVRAKNNSGAEVTGENYLEYLELTTFENDFSEILYGPVKINELKILAGDLVWGEATLPTVRNTGNTRGRIKIWQNDFGLGKTNGAWNLNYQAKVGAAADFISYPPEQTTTLNNILELSQTAKMTFTVLINKFPELNSGSAYWGKMLLSADKVEPLSCK